jgi:hypothetical protein
MIYHFTPLFFRVLVTLVALDFIAWWGLDGILRRRQAGRGWRLFLAAEMLLILGGLALFILSRFLPGLHGPPLLVKAALSAVLIWHFLLVLPTILFLLGYAIASGIAALARRRSGPPLPATGMSRRQFVGLAASSIAPGATILLTGVSLEELSRFRIRRLDVPVPGLPPALDGLTVAHLSDLHVGRLTEGAVLDAMVRETNALNAEVIVVTGDLINYGIDDLPHAIALLKQLRAPYGPYVCEGNHDVMAGPGPFREQMRASGLTFLLQEGTIASIRGENVQFLGTGWSSGHDDDLHRDIAGVHPLLRPDAFPILLAHHPHAFDHAAPVGFPLVLSGHIHGGQLMLTKDLGVGPLVFRYWSGIYRKPQSTLVVSNGIGNWFPLRVNAPAEILHLTLRRAEAEATA